MRDNFGLGFGFLLVLSACLSNQTCFCATMEDLMRLNTDLLANYSKDIRPAVNHTDVLNISVDFYMMALISFDEVESELEVNSGICITWIDHRLTWTPNDYGGVTYQTMSPSQMWYPDLFIVTSTDELESFHGEEFKAQLYYNGIIYWCPGKLIKSSCSADMTNFPTDTQTCTLIMTPWGYPSTQIQLLPSRTDFNMKYYTENGEWEISSSAANIFSGYLPVVSGLEFTLVMKRKYLYFFVFLLIPLVILCISPPMVFLLPVSSGERVSYIITMFLSLAVYMTMVQHNIPEVSEPMAILSYFMLTTLLYTCIVLVLTIFTLRCEAMHDVNDFPKWILRASTWYKHSCKKRPPVSEPKSKTITDEPKGHICSTEEKPKEDNNPDKEDILKFIDSVLFTFSALVMVVIIIGFSASFVRF